MKIKPPKLINVGHLEPDSTWQMKTHSHACHEMIVIMRGKIHVRIGEKNLQARTGDILFYPAGFIHIEQSDHNDPVESIFLGWEGDGRRFPLLAHDSRGRIRLMSRWLYEERQHPYPDSRLLQEEIFKVILVEFLRVFTYKERALVRKTRDIMRDQLEKTISLDDLVKQVGMSKYHFLRKYKNLTGRTPMTDLRIIRVETARELILTTNLPLKAIAAKVGLANQYHLSRMFRRYLNLTPGYFRRNIT